MGSLHRPSSRRMMHQGLDLVLDQGLAEEQGLDLAEEQGLDLVLDRGLVEEQRHPFQEQMGDRVGEVVHHHLHHIFRISRGSCLPSILSMPLPSLYKLPLDGCPYYSKDVDYHTQIYHVLVAQVVAHHHLHHIFHISPGSCLPSILSMPLPSLYKLPLDGCPYYSKDADYRIQIYHALQHRDPF